MKRYRGPITDHFDGEHFHNPENGVPRGTGGLLQWLANRHPAPWKKWIDSPPGPPPPSRMSDGGIRATFVGHSTVLIQMDRVNILCDPIWSMRASPFSWIGPRRHRRPGIRFEDLPPVDVVLQSHDHYDHLDVPTLRRITKTRSPKFVVPLGVRARLISHCIPGGSEAAELDWWQSAAISDGVRVTAVPARHFSGRGPRDRDFTLWCGYVIEGPSGSVYFAGDTGYGPHFREIRERFPSLRLAFIPIGAFRPQWFMGAVHISPEDAIRAHRDLGANASIGIHFGVFRLADDGQDEPVDRLQNAIAESADPSVRFWILAFGEGRDIP